MTKSYESFLQELYLNILSDVKDAYPALHKDLERDYSRLLSSLKLRGASFFTIELVEVGKHFDKCIALGQLTRSKLAQQRPFKTGAVVPRLFKGLLLLVFKASGELLDSPDVNAIRYLRQLYYAAKKIRMECTDERTRKQVRSFFRIESDLRSPSLEWDSDDFDATGTNHLHFGEDFNDHRDLAPSLFDLEQGEVEAELGLLHTFQTVCDILASELGWFNPSSYRLKHGPGAVSGQRKGSSKYEFYHWPDKLERVFPMADFAFANYALWADALLTGETAGRFSKHEPPSVLVAVPKTQKSPRLIAKEPTAHQWCQQSMLAYFAERIAATSMGLFVDFRRQEHNRKAALDASRDGNLMTVDLSSASDRLTCWTVERVFRRNRSLLDALQACRTRWCENTIDPYLPRYIKLKKFASQGSACTFPVQSFVFGCAAIAATLYEYKWSPTPFNIRVLEGKVRVFGDDIIIDKDVGSRFVGLLRYLQLEVNRDKTFGTGKFRESCGCDAYNGVDVTPTYVMTYPRRDRPESVSSAVDTHNNLLREGYCRTAAWLESAIRRSGFNIPNVWTGSGSFGLWRNERPSNRHLKRRWNEALSRLEYLCHLPTGKVKLVADRGNSSLLQYFTEEPAPTVMWKAGFLAKRPSLLMKRGWSALEA